MCEKKKTHTQWESQSERDDNNGRNKTSQIYSHFKAFLTIVIAQKRFSENLQFAIEGSPCVCQAIADHNHTYIVFFWFGGFETREPRIGHSWTLNGDFFDAFSLCIRHLSGSERQHPKLRFFCVCLNTAQTGIMVVETNRNSHRGTLFYSFEVPKDQNLLTGFKRYYGYKIHIQLIFCQFCWSNKLKTIVTANILQ